MPLRQLVVFAISCPVAMADNHERFELSQRHAPTTTSACSTCHARALSHAMMVVWFKVIAGVRCRCLGKCSSSLARCATLLVLDRGVSRLWLGILRRRVVLVAVSRREIHSTPIVGEVDDSFIISQKGALLHHGSA